MHIFESNDPSVQTAIYHDPDIFEKVYIDGADMQALFTPRDNVLYVGGYNEHGLIGMLELHPKNNSTGIIHGGVLKHQRKHSREFTLKAIKYCFDKYPQLQTIIDETPTYHMGTINFIWKCGFYYVGTIYNAVSIHGKMYDIVIQQFSRNQL